VQQHKLNPQVSQPRPPPPPQQQQQKKKNARG
jgi:hypothetical protein